MSDREYDRIGAEARLGELEELERETQRIRRSMSGTTGTGESPDGMIEATVGVYGELVELDIDPRIYRTQDAEALAEQICTAVNAAREAAQDQVRRDLVRYVGTEDEGPSGIAFEPFLRQLGRLTKGESR
jgi:DNA-binding protein YbaB